MQFRDYVWPHNPRTYTIEYRRVMAAHKVPFGRYTLQNLGLTRRVMEGEGEFAGAGAYDEFKKLASLFYQEGAGVLIHPVWQVAKAHFVELALTQEPRQDYVRYRFVFWEDFEGYDKSLKPLQPQSAEAGSTAATQNTAQYYTVLRGDTLWRIANVHGLALSRLLELNPQIKNPNLIYPGEQVRVS